MHRHLRAARRLAAATAVATLALVPAVVSAPHTRAAAAVLTGPAARDGTTSRATRIAQLAEERKALQPAVIAQNRQRRSTERAGGAGPRVATGTVTPKVGSLNSLHTWPSVGIATVPLAADIAGVVPTNDRGGYWLLGFDGSMVPFGDAPYFGDALSAGTVDVWVGAAEDAAGDGYWEVDAAGCVLAFGGASSTLEDACGRVNGVATAITATHSSQGYWILDSSGFVHFFGNATTSGARAWWLAIPSSISNSTASSTPNWCRNSRP